MTRRRWPNHLAPSDEARCQKPPPKGVLTGTFRKKAGDGPPPPAIDSITRLAGQVHPRLRLHPVHACQGPIAWLLSRLTGKASERHLASDSDLKNRVPLKRAS
jgi:hypothetical protein